VLAGVLVHTCNCTKSLYWGRPLSWRICHNHMYGAHFDLNLRVGLTGAELLLHAASCHIVRTVRTPACMAASLVHMYPLDMSCTILAALFL
jgi:hypothetical protein